MPAAPCPGDPRTGYPALHGHASRARAPYALVPPCAPFDAASRSPPAPTRAAICACTRWRPTCSSTGATSATRRCCCCRGRVLVVDSQVTPRAAQPLLAQLRALTDRPVRFVFNTHYHGDHVGGNAAFAGAEILGSARTARFMVERADERLAYARTFGLEVEEAPPPLPPTPHLRRAARADGRRRAAGAVPRRSGGDTGCGRAVVAPARRVLAAATAWPRAGYPYLGVPFLDEGLRDDGEWIGCLSRLRGPRPRGAASWPRAGAGRVARHRRRASTAGGADARPAAGRARRAERVARRRAARRRRLAELVARIERRLAPLRAPARPRAVGGHPAIRHLPRPQRLLPGGRAGAGGTICGPARSVARAARRGRRRAGPARAHAPGRRRPTADARARELVSPRPPRSLALALARALGSRPDIPRALPATAHALLSASSTSPAPRRSPRRSTPPTTPGPPPAPPGRPWPWIPPPRSPCSTSAPSRS